MNIQMKNVNLFHIGYSPETIQSMPNGFKLLDNANNPRPDWFEYWPIRDFLLKTKLKKNQYYGFFSPKFGFKTGHDYDSLSHQISTIDKSTDVVFVCPQPEVGSLFLNLYHGSDFTDSGALETCQSIFSKIDASIDLRKLITDSRNTIYSNYFIAKPAFWEKWLEVCETIFEMAEHETTDTELKAELNKKTNYGTGAERKIFVIEGVASVIIKHFGYSTKSIEIKEEQSAKGAFYKIKNEALVCDSLKIAYQATALEPYLDLFQQLSQESLHKLLVSSNRNSKPKGSTMKQTPAHDKYNDTIFTLLNELAPKNVVEVGCMRGTLAKAYFEVNPNSIWHGIDIDEDNIEFAKDICTDAVVANVEHLTESDYARYQDSDTWIFGDVLEHLYNPWELLKKIRLNAKKDITIIACIPNSQHWNFQARVNSGMMQYENDGLFDRTHIRFFSRTTMVELFEQSGYDVAKMFARNISFPGAEKYMPHIRAMAQVSGMDPDQAERDASAFQYVICATPKK
jgi:2-polyprenyl-3-methyl-5-hydroxy-6-metoxy-1,4-benzoquinol methylase